VAVQLMKAYSLDREALLIRGGRSGTGDPNELVTAAAAALGSLVPAAVQFGGGAISVTSPDGRCRAVITSGGSLEFRNCGAGELVRSPLRAAFRIVEPAQALERRGQVAEAYPVQAISLGGQAAILALGGDAPREKYNSGGVIVVPFANGGLTPPVDESVDAAIRQVLRRVWK
jgi:hypothetical protein